VYFEVENRGNFFDYLFQLKKWKWCTFLCILKYAYTVLLVCVIIENHRKYLTLERTGIEPLEAAINLQKKCAAETSNGPILENTVASHAGHRHGFRGPHVVHSCSRKFPAMPLVCIFCGVFVLNCICELRSVIVSHICGHIEQQATALCEMTS